VKNVFDGRFRRSVGLAGAAPLVIMAAHGADFSTAEAAQRALARRQPGIDLIYEPTTVFKHGPSLDFLEHDCTSIQQGSALALPSG